MPQFSNFKDQKHKYFKHLEGRDDMVHVFVSPLWFPGKIQTQVIILIEGTDCLIVPLFSKIILPISSSELLQQSWEILALFGVLFSLDWPLLEMLMSYSFKPRSEQKPSIRHIQMVTGILFSLLLALTDTHFWLQSLIQLLLVPFYLLCLVPLKTEKQILSFSYIHASE